MLITTIRNEGDNHMIMVEGNGWGNQYHYMEPYTFSPNWGLVYNAHRYGCSTSPDATNSDPNQINELGNLKAFSNQYQVISEYDFLPTLMLLSSMLGSCICW